MRGRIQYAPTLTDQKLDSLLSIESSARYILGRIQYAPTLTDQKLDSFLSIESPARYVRGRMQYAPTHTGKNWIPLYPLNQKLGTFWDVCNTPLHIRIKNWIPFYPLNYPPGTCGGVFNRYIPKRDTYLWDTYLSIPILGEDRVARKPSNRLSGTCGGVCNTSLHIQAKNWVVSWLMIHKPDTCGGVCNTPLP